MAGRIRWSRFALVMGLGVAGMSTFGVAAATGAVPVSFTVSGGMLQASGERFDGKGIAIFGGVVQTKDKAYPAVMAAFDEADVRGICAGAVLEGVPVLGSVGLGIESEGFTARSVVVAIDELRTAATINDVRLGVDAGAASGAGPAGSFGVQAGSASLRDFHLNTRAVTAGTISLSGMKVNALTSKLECK
ncbi:hypothetical protein D5S17_29825 [Pseudonocardiaceae bacterium YIM PH 21723]|nr:hypothetical protein D5S17_29825 [Pseudonocardiaceae bacterium YIM PH 21723]